LSCTRCSSRRRTLASRPSMCGPRSRP
jgi:hypothetical protein